MQPFPVDAQLFDPLMDVIRNNVRIAEYRRALFENATCKNIDELRAMFDEQAVVN